MTYQQTIQHVRTELITTFKQLDVLFDLEQDIRQVRPAPDEWCIDEILEHITLTNHFLMITLDNSRQKVLKRAKIQPIPNGESDLDAITVISDPNAFAWIRPEHMEPTHEKPMSEVRQIMTEQRDQCLAILEDVKSDEGALHTVRMSVQDLGSINGSIFRYSTPNATSSKLSGSLNPSYSV